MRQTFAECKSVSANSRSPSDTNHSGVATPVPSCLRLVRLRYRPGKSASRSAAGRSMGRLIVWVVMVCPSVEAVLRDDPRGEPGEEREDDGRREPCEAARVTD